MGIARSLACAVVALSLAASGCSEEEVRRHEESPTAELERSKRAPAAHPKVSPRQRREPKIAKPRGRPPKRLVKKDLVKGTGAVAETGSELTVNYVGVKFSTGKQFDSSFDLGRPYQFELGARMVIPGWDEGIEGMRAGGRRMLTIPPGKAYGRAGYPPAIGPNETLVFVIDLLDVR